MSPFDRQPQLRSIGPSCSFAADASLRIGDGVRSAGRMPAPRDTAHLQFCKICEMFWSDRSEDLSPLQDGVDQSTEKDGGREIRKQDVSPRASSPVIRPPLVIVSMLPHRVYPPSWTTARDYLRYHRQNQSFAIAHRQLGQSGGFGGPCRQEMSEMIAMRSRPSSQERSLCPFSRGARQVKMRYVVAADSWH